MNKHLKYGIIGVACGFFGGLFWKLAATYRRYKALPPIEQFAKDIAETTNDLPTVIISDSGMGLVTHELSDVHYITIPIYCADQLKTLLNSKFNEESYDIIDEFCNLISCYHENYSKNILHDTKPRMVRNREAKKVQKELEDTIRDICDKMDMTFLEAHPIHPNGELTFEEKQQRFEKYYAEREKRNMNKKESD